MLPVWLKHIYSILCALTWRPMPAEAHSRLCSRNDLAAFDLNTIVHDVNVLVLNLRNNKIIYSISNPCYLVMVVELQQKNILIKRAEEILICWLFIFTEDSQKESEKLFKERELLMNQVSLPPLNIILNFPIEVWVSSGRQFVSPEGEVILDDI